MGTRDSYEPGTFSWVELATTDAEAAKAFYGKVLDWSYEDSEMPGGGGTYTMAKVDDRYTGAIMEADGPARWNSYISVADVDETVKKARDLEAKVHADPFDVGDAGRMAVIQDPSGGVFSIWQANDHPGAGLVNAHGALSWNDLMTYDVGAAAEFYCELFGWEVAEVDASGEPAGDDEDEDEDGDDEDGDDEDGGGVHVDPDDATDAPGHDEASDNDEDDDDEDEDEDEDDEDDDEEPAPGSETTRGPAERLAIRNGERLNGGMATIPEAAGDAVPPHWLPYFGVESIHAAVTAVRDGGGQVMAEPIDVPTGKIAVMADPQGAVFAVFAGDLQD